MVDDDPQTQSLAAPLGDAALAPMPGGASEPVGCVTYKGVILASRFKLKSEFEQMCRVLDAMPEAMTQRIESIWCDSKTGADFAIGVKPEAFAPELPDQIADAFRAAGGFDALAVYGGDGQFQDFDACRPDHRAMVA